MKKPILNLAKPSKLKRFAQESTRWDSILEGLKQKPYVWHRIKGANLNDAVALRGSHINVLEPYKFEVRVRHQRQPNIKVWARVVAQRAQLDD